MDSITFIKNINVKRNKTDNEFNSWDQLQSTKPVSGVIIADPYLFKTNFDLSKEIYKVTNNNAIDLTCFVGSKDMDFELCRRQWSVLKQNFTGNISVVQVSGKNLHDRNILTNFTHINCGQSFYNLKDSISVDTIVTNSGIASKKSKEYFDLLRSFKNLVKNAKEDFDMVGSGKNVLFESAI